MTTLDANHGHYLSGVYHYHGTAAAPYMIGNMVGQVTEDANLQIIPQAQAKPIRTAGTPLSGGDHYGVRVQWQQWLQLNLYKIGANVPSQLQLDKRGRFYI